MCTFQLCFPQYGGPSLVSPSAENTVLQLCKEYLDALMVQYWYEFKTSPGGPRPRDLCFLGWGGGVLFSVILLWKFKKIEFSRTPPLPYPTRSMQSANISTNPLNTVDWQIIRMVLIFCSVKFKPSRLALFEKFPVFGKVSCLIGEDLFWQLIMDCESSEFRTRTKAMIFQHFEGVRIFPFEKTINKLAK